MIHHVLGGHEVKVVDQVAPVEVHLQEVVRAVQSAALQLIQFVHVRVARHLHRMAVVGHCPSLERLVVVDELQWIVRVALDGRLSRLQVDRRLARASVADAAPVQWAEIRIIRVIIPCVADNQVNGDCDDWNVRATK